MLLGLYENFYLEILKENWILIDLFKFGQFSNYFGKIMGIFPISLKKGQFSNYFQNTGQFYNYFNKWWAFY
jgi:hypothetical protein